MTEHRSKYRLVRRLATGGMAEVFRARAEGPAGFEKEVCLKRVLPHLARDPEFVEMFKAEARLAAKLQHANIVQIFDFGEEDGAYYLAMEYVDGGDLRRLLEGAKRAGRPLPVGLAAFIAHAAAQGLAYAHSRQEGSRPLGIVHRDISPHNLLISQSGEVKITDFGIAKAASRATATHSGVLKGKLAYMAPEQARAERVDARADIFSLGVVLHEMLTGRRLFQAETESETLARVLGAPIAPPRTLAPGVPEALSSLTLRALAREPADRFQHAHELARELARSLFSLPPEEATAPALAAYLREVLGAAPQSEEPGETQALGEAAQARPPTPEGPFPVAGPADPTRQGDVAQAATSVTRAEGARPARAEAGRRLALALLGLAAVAVVVGVFAWWDHDGSSVGPRSPASLPATAGVRPWTAPVLLPAPLEKRAPRSSEAAPAPQVAGPTAPSSPAARRPPFRGTKKRPAAAKAAAAARPVPETVAAAGLPLSEPPPGFLQVIAIPWADIFLDGKLVSNMPQAGIPVRPGKYRLRLRNAARGYDRTIEVEVASGDTTKVIREVDDR